MISAGIAAALENLTGELTGSFPLAGGCINESCRLTGRDGRQWFLKLNDAEYLDMFAAEAAGLKPKTVELTRIAENLVQTSADDARKNLKLMELLEDNDDVQAVYSNLDIPDELTQEA